MSGYSKMRLQKPKSMDSSSDSDLFYFSQPHKNNVKITPNEEEKPTPAYKINNLHSSPNPKDHIQVGDGDDVDRKIDDTQLKSSGRSFSTRGFKLSRENSGRSDRLSATVESAVKKVLPMRRSSSVSEGYCRIVYDEFLDEIDEEGYYVGTETTSGKKKMKKMGNGVRILKACKRIFGF